MKIVMTGHTVNTGKAIYDYLIEQGHEVIGCSRRTGYDLYNDSDVNRIVELAIGSDLFLNLTHIDNRQLELLNKLYDKVGMMIVFGSVASEYTQFILHPYAKEKLELAERCKHLSTIPGNKILHLNLTFMEDAVSSDVKLEYHAIVNTIDFWLKNPYIRNIDFEIKLTPYTMSAIQKTFNLPQEVIDFAISKMCDENRQAFNAQV
jgi:hypothetical protein